MDVKEIENEALALPGTVASRIPGHSSANCRHNIKSLDN
jgi:hypothetical protein